jgi:hypothetical protein
VIDMLQFEDTETLAAIRHHRMSLTGAGAGVVPALTIGHGVVLSWTATGRVLITWAENPGTFVGIGSAHFRDPTQSIVKGWTCTAGAYPASASTFTLEIDFWNSAFAAADLALTSFLDLDLVFSELKVP